MNFADEIRKSVKKPQTIKISCSELKVLEEEIIRSLVEEVKRELKAAARMGSVKNNRISYCLCLKSAINKQVKPEFHLTYYENSPFSYYVTAISKDSLSRIINGIIQDCRYEGIKLKKDNIFTTNFETLSEKKRNFIEGRGCLCILTFFLKQKKTCGTSF